MRLIATCPEETKAVLVDELRALGADGIEPGFRAVAFTADEQLFYEAHLRLRTASRLLRVIKEVPAHSSVMLYSQARRIPWPELFDAQHSFAVEVLGTGRGGPPPKAVLTQVREAIRDVFERSCGTAPKVDPDSPRVVVVAHLVSGRCTLSLDTSGKSLHKRGYRVAGHPAPLKETLAASVLALAGYDGTQPFMDPMCGSGTIAVEAAFMALRRAPLILRKKGDFGFEWLRGHDHALWRQVCDRARAGALETNPAPLLASDIDAGYVELTRQAALAARVERYLQLGVARFQDCTPPAETGILVTNLPYGARLASSPDELGQLYEEVGDTLKQRFAGWTAAVLAVEDSPYQRLGLRPARKVPLLNGSIACKLLVFELYAGTRRKRPAEPAPPQAV